MFFCIITHISRNLTNGKEKDVMFRKKLKRIGAWMLTMSMLFGAVSFPSVRVHAADSENSAVSATATASSVEAGSTPASKVNDGDSSSKSSRWSSAR